jgi:hypothetical protein
MHFSTREHLRQRFGNIRGENRRIKSFIVKDLIPQQIIFRLLAELYRRYVLSTRAFLTPAFRIGNLLTLLQSVETDTLYA